MRILYTLIALAAPLPLSAQVACPSGNPTIELPDCMVGSWGGSANISERLEAMLARMPAAARTEIRSNLLQGLFQRIYEDGFYVSAPWAGYAEFVPPGSDVEFRMDVLGEPTAGWMWPISGAEQFDFCVVPGTSHATFNFSSPGGSTTLNTRGLPSNNWKPEITMTCGGDAMQMLVALPEPIGTVTYEFTRLPDAPLPEALQSLADTHGHE